MPFTITIQRLLQRFGQKKYAFLVLGSLGEVIKSNQSLYSVVQIHEENNRRGDEGDEDEIRKNLTPEEEEGEDNLFDDDE